MRRGKKKVNYRIDQNEMSGEELGLWESRIAPGVAEGEREEK